MWEQWRQQAAALKRELHALYLAYKDPRVPWHVKLCAACIVGYAFSPIDLIPDFIPVLGYLDDLILLPIGIYFVLNMIPVDVMAECREKARAMSSQRRPVNYVAASVIVTIWIGLALLSARLVVRVMRD